MASSNRIKGITIEIGGDATGLDKALNDVNKNINQTEKNLKDINKALKLDPGNADLVRQKQEALAKAVEETSKKLKTLKEASKQAAEQLSRGEISKDQYNALQREIIYCEKELSGLIKETKSLGSVTSEKLKAVGDSFQSVGSKIESAGRKISSVSAVVAGIGATCVKLASNTEESMNKVEQVFGSSAKGIKDFAQTTLDSYGISEGTALDMASLFGDMGTSMGLSTAKAADMSTSLVGLAGDLSSFKNIGLEQSMNALKGVFTGETESLKNIGIVMTQTNLDAYAMSKGFNQTTNDMTEAQKVMLRYQYVMEKTHNAQGDFARTSNSAANSFRVFQQACIELGASLGEQLIPMITPVVQKMTEWVKSLKELPEEQQQLIAKIALFVAILGPALIVIGKVVTTIGTFIDGIALLIKFVPLIVGAITGTLIPAIVAIGTALAPILANPITWIIAAIVVALAALGYAIYEIATNWDEFKELAVECWQAIRNVMEKFPLGRLILKEGEIIIETVKDIVRDVKQAFDDGGGGWQGVMKGTWAGIKDIFKSEFKLLLRMNDEELDAFLEKIKTTYKNVVKNVTDAWKSVKENTQNFFKDYGKTLKNSLTSLPATIKEGSSGIGSAVMDAIAAPFKQFADIIKEKISDPVKSLLSDAKTWGKDLIQNFIDGVKGAKEDLKKAIQDVAQAIKDKIGFSEPKEGPLSNFHTFAPDMIDLWCQGVNENMYKINATMDRMASAMIPNNTTAGQSVESNNIMASSIDSLSSTLMNGMNANTNVTVVLEGDAKGVFKLVRTENSRMIKATGFHALA